MKFEKSDFRVILFLLLVVITFTVLFYRDLNKKIDIGDREIVGTIHFKNNIVQRKLEDQVVWETLENNSPLTNKDTIRSEAFSDAIIRLKDGTEINIDENSMFNLDLSGEKPSLEFSQGSMQVKNTNNSQASSLVIKSQGSEIDVGTGALKLEKEAKKDLNLFVENGTSKIKHNGKEVDVEGGKKASLQEGAEVAVKRIPVRLKNPSSQKLFLMEGQDTNIPFDWEMDPGFYESQIEISRSPQFKLQLVKQSVSGNRFNTRLREGTYYWRVQAKDPKTNKWEISDTGKFFVTADEPLRLDSPANNAEFAFVAEQPMIAFIWPKISTARGYHFELSNQSNFSSKLKSVETESNSVSFDDLKEGTYYWKVIAHSAFPGTPDKSAGPNKFTIKKQDAYPSPHIIRPANGSEVTSEEINKGQAIVIWEGNTELSKYRLEISKDTKFASNVFNKESASNFITPNWKDFGQGTFFVRVRGYSSDGKESEISSPVRFSIVEKKTEEEPKKEETKKEEKTKSVPLELISPLNTVVEMKNKKSLDFSWKGSPDADRYDLVLFQVAGAKRSAIYRNSVKGNSASLKDLSILDEGTFSWELTEYAEGDARQSKKGNFIISLDQLKTLKPADIEFISPKRLYKEGKH
ncbi:sigma factor regulatory protein, FecR/PupR family [Leptospira ryugenii]|uniref:Sigma factor regulatory protein, FecR/PupR family n=1 Tax=Leptospira ryugenii TaxID=1917863 RepID=A0A2P2E026_9LEPT|nr:FecR domain-containing protein [Leptospira ryugenii]GBF50235.1 sigma factor regulatory protein, FecR/PupR family [Leptospira ryugenii]